MTREEKIEAIYEAMANKKRTFGCRCRRNDGEDVIFIRENKTWSYLSIRENEEFTVSLWYTPEIIWHPVMIWDVLDYFQDKRFYCQKCSKIVDWRDVSDHNCWGEYYCDICNNDSLIDIEDDIVFYWDLKREPIDEQSERCIDFVYSLIPSKSME